MSTIAARPSFAEALAVWVYVALMSFGGPAGQIAVMHRVLVDEKRWVSESRFLHALNYCSLLPGPEAQQLITYLGWLHHGTLGGIVAGSLFVFPGFVSILLLSMLYAAFHDTTVIDALFFGMKPAVFAIVIEAVIRIGRRSLKNRLMGCVAASAFVAIFFLKVPFPLIVLGAGLFGFVGGRYRPAWFPQPKSSAVQEDESASTADPRSGFSHTMRVATTWLLLWLAPVGLLTWSLGAEHIFAQQAQFFSKAAAVTFGGAYAVLPYVSQQAVERYHWVNQLEMLDGLGMAETTPGPLIQIVQFVAYLGAYRDPHGLSPWVAGVLASMITTWVTFVPSFLWIFTGAPYVERLGQHRALRTALSTITAAVVGVVLNLAVWFALQVLFVYPDGAPVQLMLPVGIQWPVVLIAAAAMWLVFRLHANMMLTIGSCALLGFVLRWLM